MEVMESSVIGDSSQSLQHKQKIFEASFWWVAVGWKGMRAIISGIYILDVHWKFIVMGVILGQPLPKYKAFPSLKSSVAPHGQSRLPSLKSIFPILIKFSYPWKGVEASTVPALPVVVACWISWSWIWAYFPGQSCFLNKHETIAEKMPVLYPCSQSR